MFKLPVQLFFTYIDVFLWPFLIFFLSGLEILQIFTLKKSSGWTEAHFWCCSLNLNIFLHFNFLICDLSCVICVIWVCLCHRRGKKHKVQARKVSETSMVLTAMNTNLLVWSKNDALKEPKQNQRLGKFLRMNEKEKRVDFQWSWGVNGGEEPLKWLPTVSFNLHLHCQLMWKCGFKWESVNRGSDTKMLGVALRSIVIQLSLGEVHDAEQ